MSAVLNFFFIFFLSCMWFYNCNCNCNLKENRRSESQITGVAVIFKRRSILKQYTVRTVHCKEAFTYQPRVINSGVCTWRIGAGGDVQRPLGARKPSLGRRVQASAARWRRHLRAPVNEDLPHVETNRHRRRESPNYCRRRHPHAAAAVYIMMMLMIQ